MKRKEIIFKKGKVALSRDIYSILILQTCERKEHMVFFCGLGDLLDYHKFPSVCSHDEYLECFSLRRRRQGRQSLHLNYSIHVGIYIIYQPER